MKIHKTDNSAIYYRCNIDDNWTVKELSKSSENILEYNYADLISNHITFGEIISKNDILKVKQVINEAILKNEPFQITYEMQAKSMKKAMFEQGRAIYDNFGKAIELTGFITDISMNSFSQNQADFNTNIRMWINEIKELVSQLNLNTTNETIDTISDREIIAALYFSQGMTMKQIALFFSLSPRTIEAHLFRIKNKLGCRTKTALRRLFFETNSGKDLIIDSLKMLSEKKAG